jgi:hypothetical protein
MRINLGDGLVPSPPNQTVLEPLAYDGFDRPFSLIGAAWSLITSAVITSLITPVPTPSTAIPHYVGSAVNSEGEFDFVNYPSAEHWKHARQLAYLRERIYRFANRSFDWDGDGGNPPNIDAQMDAHAFLEGIPDGRMPDVILAPGDGEIVFQWRKDGQFIEVGFYGDGTISWYIDRVDGRSPRHSDDPFDRRNPHMVDQNLMSFLTA